MEKLNLKLSRLKRRSEYYINSTIIKLIKNPGIIITGCGRSGTTYISKYFKKIGFDVGHERLGVNGISSWYLSSEQKKVPFGPSLNEVSYLPFPIVHQVREPLQSISSIQSIGKLSWDFIKKEVPINDSDSGILKSMKYWYFWNIKSENKSIFTYRIESLDESIFELCRMAKIDIASSKLNMQLNKKINSRKHKHLTWDDLRKESIVLTDQIIEMGKNYGYKISE